MKLRTDLLAKLTPEMMLEGILANTPRYKPEPLFSKTGTGSLSSASTGQSASEEALSSAIIRKLKQVSGRIGNAPNRKR